MKLLTALGAFALVLALPARADLVINAAELGIGKFHRKDNAVHPHQAGNVWIPFVLGENAPLTTPQVIENADHSVTIFFSHLDELLRTLVRVSQEKQTPITVLNLEAHGMPGGMWFPKNEAEMRSAACADWVESAEAADDANYNQYYSAISKNDIMTFRRIANMTTGNFGCVAGKDAFRSVAAQVAGLREAFAPNAQVHLVSCLVGLGARGDQFTKALAEVFLNGNEGRVMSSFNFGLGDWSMPDGMGFWDYQNDQQLARDNERYVREKRDASMAQPGTMRVAQIENGVAISGVMENVDLMLTTLDSRPYRRTVSEPATLNAFDTLPLSVRIPGTQAQALRVME